MNRTDFLRLYRYSDNVWRLFGETLAENPNAWDAPFETTSQWCSIRLLIGHCIAAEERLITLRLRNLPLPTPFDVQSAATWDDIYKAHRVARAATYAYLDSLSDEEIEDDAPVIPAIEGRGPLTRSDVLIQIFNHENFHRGQAIMTLQRLGLDPPNFDYILYK